MRTQNIPNLFILGAAKAGTTTLSKILSKHHQVYFPKVKETLFFSNDDIYSRGLNWYARSFFSEVENQKIICEATPHYLYWADKVAPRIKKAIKGENVKFVVILRNPIERTYSAYWNMVSEGLENMSFRDAIEAETRRLSSNAQELRFSGSMKYGYLRGSNYSSQLSTYFKYFHKQSFFFLFLDELKDQFQKSITGLHQFLNINTNSEIEPLAANASRFPRSIRLQRIINQESYVKSIYKRFMPMRFRYAIRSFIARNNFRRIDYQPIGMKDEIYLRAYFQQEISSLGQLINKDLSNWL